MTGQRSVGNNIATGAEPTGSLACLTPRTPDRRNTDPGSSEGAHEAPMGLAVDDDDAVLDETRGTWDPPRRDVVRMHEDADARCGFRERLRVEPPGHQASGGRRTRGLPLRVPVTGRRPQACGGAALLTRFPGQPWPRPVHRHLALARAERPPRQMRSPARKRLTAPKNASGRSTHGSWPTPGSDSNRADGSASIHSDAISMGT